MRRGILSIVGSRIDDVRVPRTTKRPILIAPKIATLRRRAVGREDHRSRARRQTGRGAARLAAIPSCSSRE